MPHYNIEAAAAGGWGWGKRDFKLARAMTFVLGDILPLEYLADLSLAIFLDGKRPWVRLPYCHDFCPRWHFPMKIELRALNSQLTKSGGPVVV